MRFEHTVGAICQNDREARLIELNAAVEQALAHRRFAHEHYEAARQLAHQAEQGFNAADSAVRRAQNALMEFLGGGRA